MKSKIYLIVIFNFKLIVCGVTLQAQEKKSIDLDPIDVESFEVMSQFFDYDKDIPLDARVVDIADHPNFTKEKIVFRGINNSRVPGYLAIPKNTNSPVPCVLLIHGVGDTKDSWWNETSFNSGGLLSKQLIDAGFAVLALDAQYHGERAVNNDFESPDVFIFQKEWLIRARNMIVQSVIEYRRVMDYLSTRREIDSNRFGAIGYSMGGMMIFNLASVDKRIKVAVASVTPILKEEYSALAVYNFAPFINSTSFLMLNGKDDGRNYNIEEAQQLFELLNSDNKNIRFFESGHKLPVEWTQNASDWIKNHMN